MSEISGGRAAFMESCSSEALFLTDPPIDIELTFLSALKISLKSKGQLGLDSIPCLAMVLGVFYLFYRSTLFFSIPLWAMGGKG
jgi:hypothetical protein